MSFQHEKAVIRAFYSALDEPDSDVASVLKSATADEYLWRGFHPFNEVHGAAEVAKSFWEPLRKSLTGLQRREDIFFAGSNEIDGHQSHWVVSMGHLMGLFDHSFLGIPPTGKMAFLRYCEFNRVEGGRITETAMFFDIPHLMRQAGLNPFPVQTAMHLVQPGPATHDGNLNDPHPAQEGEKTLKLINAMIADLGEWNSGLTLEEELRRTWHEDMIWWGPEGIGATYTIERYAKQHAGPFRQAFSARSATGHLAKLAEGHYGGFFGWPNFKARLTGNFMGIPATQDIGEFRVIDVYRRREDKLAENWIFIDLLHFWKGQGIDVLQNMQTERSE